MSSSAPDAAQAAWTTRSGFELEPAFGPEHLARRGVDDLAEWAGEPGAYPFTRGLVPDGYRSRPWIVGQYAGFGSAAEANARFRMLLERGQTGFSVALDLPTQMGMDSDHPLAAGEVGKVGVAIDSLADMEALFDGIPLEQVRQIRTTANAIGPIWLALVVALGREKSFDPAQVAILIQNDVLKEYIARGTFIFAPRPAVRLAADTIEYCARHLPGWTPLTMSGYHIREAGADAAQELAFTFANGIAYCEEAMRRGLPVDAFAPSLFSFLSVGTDLLEEVAKLRAARRVWARVIRERLGGTRPESMGLRIFAFSAGSELTAQQPMNNVVRVTLAATAAVLAGCQTLHTSSYDEALATPTAHAATLALRTQQVLMEESGLRGTADPLGGSWAVEALTHDVEARTWDLLERIEELGGAIECVETGWFKNELAEAAYRHHLDVQSGRRRVVGVNVQQDDGEVLEPEVFRVDPASEAGQVRRLREVREKRSAEAVAAALGRLRDAAAGDENVVPAVIDAVTAYATVGEITDTLRQALEPHHGG